MQPVAMQPVAMQLVMEPAIQSLEAGTTLGTIKKGAISNAPFFCVCST